MMVIELVKTEIDKSLELLSDMTVDIVRIPNKMDPDEFLQAK